jgi:catechol 2,3-dioxygenase-like lactoylglutathione lyase family enzyme
MSVLQITQIDHCSIIITNVERSRRFYGDLLGLQEIHKPRTFDFVVVWFDLGNQHLHLLLKDKPDTLSPRHFALRVTDAQEARRYFQEHGLATEETTPIPGADRFFIYDPDGNRIEIIQWQRPYDSAENAPPAMNNSTKKPFAAAYFPSWGKLPALSERDP